jgi:hypothetical protein
MTFLAPGFLFAALAAALGITALHFIAMRQPPSDLLPTTRFIPERPAVTRTITRTPEDVLLLLLRVLALLLIGAAFARPIRAPHRRSVLHIVLADRSRAVADPRAVTDSARAVLDGDGVLILFDSSARTIERGGSDSLGSPPRARVDGSITPALVAALRTASRLRDQADSLELTIVSPFAAAELDAATDSVVAQWPGGWHALRLVPVAQSADTGGAHPTVNWPADGHTAGATDRTLAGTGGAKDRALADTVGAVVAGDVVLAAPFARRWEPDTTGPGTRVIARWVDGAPAAVERGSDAACTRDVAVALPAAGDLVLTAGYRRFVAALAAPCGSPVGSRPPAHPVAAQRGTHIPARAIEAAADVASPLVPWLLGLALAAALGELVLRRRRGMR